MSIKQIFSVMCIVALGFIFSRLPSLTSEAVSEEVTDVVVTTEVQQTCKQTITAPEGAVETIVVEPVQEAEQATTALEAVVEPPVAEDTCVKEIVESLAAEATQEVTEQVMTLSDPIEEVEYDFVYPATSHTGLDSVESVAWDRLNDARERSGLPRLSFAFDLLDGCREHANSQRSRGRLWHDKSRPSGTGENCASSRAEDGELPINQWLNSSGHRRFMLSSSINEGALGRSGVYFVFRARYGSSSSTSRSYNYGAKAVNVSDTQTKKYSSGDSCDNGSCDRDYGSQSRYSRKVFSRKGKPRPFRSALRRLFR
jgi:uncharacterized protein YkwD